MLKAKPERMTYAQKRLITLIEERKLRRWCLDNGITHSGAYRLAIGEQPPTYRIIASMCHLIAPIEWLFFIDESLPYEPELLPLWSCKEPCKYVKEHRYDYKTIASQHNLELLNAYNIFVAYRANPTPAFIRELCSEVNPSDFFTGIDGDIKSLKEFVPDRGDIVSVEGKIILVISKADVNEANKIFTGCVILAQANDGIKLENALSKGFVSPSDIQSFAISSLVSRTLIEKADAIFTEKVLAEVRKNFA